MGLMWCCTGHSYFSLASGGICAVCLCRVTITAREERKAMWRQQGKQSLLHCKKVIGKSVSVFVCTLKLGKRGSSSHAISPLTPRRFYKLSRDPGLQTAPTSPKLTCWHHVTEQLTPKFLAALGWEELYWGRHLLCRKGPPNRYTPGRGVSFAILSGEKWHLEMLLEKKDYPSQPVQHCASFRILPLFLSRPSKMSFEDVTVLPSLLVSSCESLTEQVIDLDGPVYS